MEGNNEKQIWVQGIMKYLFWSIVGIWLIIGIVYFYVNFGWLGAFCSILIAQATVLIAMVNNPIAGLISFIALTLLSRRVA